jgi:RIO-like serine/threonine protein kinase
MRTRKNKVGGRILGEGRSGIVVYPAIPCKDGRNMTRYVSRIVGKRKHKRTNPNVDLVSNNKQLVSKLKKIDPKQKYMLYPLVCEAGELLQENIQDGVKKHTRSELYLKGGITWETYLLTEKPTEKQLAHILKAFAKLHEAKITHGDVRADNIVLGNDKLPRLIDFGSAIYDSPPELIEREQMLIKELSPSFGYDIVTNPRVTELRRMHRDVIYSYLDKQRGF